MQWIEPAARHLMNCTGFSLLEEDAAAIGFDVFYRIVSTKFSVDTMRKMMEYNVPDLIKDPNCETYASCSAVWTAEWWNGLAPHILHPNYTTVGERIKKELKSCTIPGVCVGCQTLTFDVLEELGTFSRDSELIEECISDVKGLCGDTSPLEKPLYTDRAFTWSL
ncbi:hypothetical protein DFP72DRAFT_1072521 [Ephemerocybe angulata]|uniref:Uncharacterized protein n=1 Tax=Ephemerocybe angulata TaxID=980116 RepID=A0A8H6HNB7_9AGAR|nr:hypothetical protein DFP72DRAFT_1072521 [Tulosesus angulatus]